MNARRWLPGLISLLIICSATALTPELASVSASGAPPGPDRFAVVTVDYTAHQWFMATWKYQDVVCEIIVDHEGNPLPGEIYRDCGETIYKSWIKQEPCNHINKKLCAGYYIFPGDTWVDQKEIGMELTPASAWITLEDCHPVFSTGTYICESTPTLVIYGTEPLPDESIIRVEGEYDGRRFLCKDTDICKFPIEPTDETGVDMTFWAYSTYGDSSDVFTARVRVQLTDEGDPDQLYYYVDVLSTQWKGETAATCSGAWGVFPPVGGAPNWLSTPKASTSLSSDIPYTYLAANLILQGVVNASSCPDGGIVAGGAANQCGVEAARHAVTEWQNRFDDLILSTSHETGVPARLLKNLFARESQFWPGIYQGMEDAGLGQLTENGADTTLFWNDSFYEQFCPAVLPEAKCGKGYMHLKEEEQLELRRALVSSVNASCENCPLGLDLTQADFSVTVFAHTMIANCEQAGQVVHNYTGKSPGEVATYEDLWKFTLVNYNAGGGCLAEALTSAYGRNLELTWENVSPFLTGACSAAVDYVNDISQ